MPGYFCEVVLFVREEKLTGPVPPPSLPRPFPPALPAIPPHNLVQLVATSLWRPVAACDM